MLLMLFIGFQSCPDDSEGVRFNCTTHKPLKVVWIYCQSLGGKFLSPKISDSPSQAMDLMRADHSLDFNKLMLQSSIGFQSCPADSKVLELTVFAGFWFYCQPGSLLSPPICCLSSHTGIEAKDLMSAVHS